VAVRKIAFSLEFEGSGVLTKQLAQVELDLGAIGNRLRDVRKDLNTFNTGTEEQRKALLDSGKSVQSLTNEYEKLRSQQIALQEDRKGVNREIRDQAKAFNELQNAIPEDSLIGLRTQYKQLRKEIDLLDEAGRQSAEGLAKITKASNIKQEILDIGKSVNDGREGVGLYTKALQDFFKLGGANGGAGGALSGVLGDIIGGGGPGGGGGGLGGAIGSLTTSLGPYAVAIGAVGGAVVQVGSYIVDVTKQFEELNSIVGNTTGLVGQELQDATVGIKTLADVFDKDFKEVLQAVNVVSKEFGEGLPASLEAVKIGLQAGADLQGNFLDSLREYSSEAERAGLSTDGFVEALVKFERAGIFGDRGADIINETETRITDFTDATRTSLNDAFGEEFTVTLFDQINDGTITAFEGVQRVAKGMQEGNLTAQQYARVTADLFGGIGEDASTAIEVIADLTGSTDGLIDSTDAYIRRQNAAIDATFELNQEQQLLAAQFAGTTFDLDTLTTKTKAFGTSLLNDLLFSFRAARKEISEGNIFQALFLTTDEDTIQGIKEEDAIALREIKEAEKEIADQRRESALEGTLGIQGLRAEQARLKQEIDDARVAGEDYSGLQQQLTAVTNNLSKATGVLNTNIQRTKAGYKELAAEGSIDQLSDRVRGLQQQISKASPNRALELIEELNRAELDLSAAKKEYDDFKESVREANIELLPIDEQVAIIEKQIALRRELELQAAQVRVSDEEQLLAEVALINAKFDKESSENRVRQYEEETADYVKLTGEISEATSNIKDLEIDVVVKGKEAALREAERLTEQALRAVFTSEEELQERIELLRLQTDSSSISTRLQLENLSADERFKLEVDLAEKTKQLKEAQAKVDIDFAARLAEIDVAERENTIIPEFNPDDIDATLEAIRAFENERTIIEQEAKVERLELERELLLRQGEETLEIEQQIAEETLKLEQEKNAGLIAEANKRAAAQAEFAKKVADAEEKAFQQIGKSLGNFLINTAEDSEAAFKQLAQGILGTVIDLIAQQATLLVTQSFAQPDSVLSFGATGATRVALITGLIQGASSALKNILTANLNAEGGVLQGGGFLRDGGVFAGLPHSAGGVKFLLNTAYGPSLQEAELNEAIISAPATNKWKGLLSAINFDGGAKSFSPETGKYLSILRGIKPTRYATGGQLGGGTGSIPMLVDPATGRPGGAVATIRSEDMESLAVMVADRFNDAGSQFAETIVGRVVAGLDESNRLKEREASASANAEI
jgi:hypothetical protein